MRHVTKIDTSYKFKMAAAAILNFVHDYKFVIARICTKFGRWTL